MFKNFVELGRPLTMWRMRFSCWMPKDTDTHSEYVILIAFPLQQWLQERASLFRYMHIARLVVSLPCVSYISCTPLITVL